MAFGALGFANVAKSEATAPLAMDRGANAGSESGPDGLSAGVPTHLAIPSFHPGQLAAGVLHDPERAAGGRVPIVAMLSDILSKLGAGAIAPAPVFENDRNCSGSGPYRGSLFESR